MLVDDKQQFISQRQWPQMALIQPMLKGSQLQVSAPGMDVLNIDANSFSDQSQVSIWQDQVLAKVAHSKINAWFSHYLNHAVQLVSFSNNSQRQVDLDFATVGQQVAFADGFPVLIAHQASLDNLNQQLKQVVPISRFRPNILVKSQLPAWDELNWRKLTHQQFKLNLPKACTRCVMTGVNQITGLQTGTEVLKTLKQHFAHQNKAVFGINAIPQGSNTTARIGVGDSMEID